MNKYRLLLLYTVTFPSDILLTVENRFCSLAVCPRMSATATSSCLSLAEVAAHVVPLSVSIPTVFDPLPILPVLPPLPSLVSVLTERRPVSVPVMWAEEEDSSERRPWNKDEDKKVFELVEKYGTKKWSLIGSNLEGRTGKQCRERWHNHLNPQIKKETWSSKEDDTIIEIHKKVGSRWSEIAKSLPGRTDNSIKNRWYSMMRRVNRQQGAPKKCSLDDDDDGDKLFRYCLQVHENGGLADGTATTTTVANVRVVAVTSNAEPNEENEKPKKRKKRVTVNLDSLQNVSPAKGRGGRKSSMELIAGVLEVNSEESNVKRRKRNAKPDQEFEASLTDLANAATKQENDDVASTAPIAIEKAKTLTLNVEDAANEGQGSDILMASPSTVSDVLFSPMDAGISNSLFYHPNSTTSRPIHFLPTPANAIEIHDVNRHALASPMAGLGFPAATPTPHGHSRFNLPSTVHRVSPTTVLQKRRFDDHILSPSTLMTSRNEDLRNAILAPAPLTNGLSHLSGLKQHHGQLVHYAVPQQFSFDVDSSLLRDSHALGAMDSSSAVPAPSPHPFLPRTLSLSPSRGHGMNVPTTTNQALAQALALSHSISHPNRTPAPPALSASSTALEFRSVLPSPQQEKSTLFSSLVAMKSGITALIPRVASPGRSAVDAYSGVKPDHKVN